jgi:hypothetical protein
MPGFNSLLPAEPFGIVQEHVDGQRIDFVGGDAAHLEEGRQGVRTGRVEVPVDA